MSEVRSINDSKMVAALGINNLVAPYFAAIIPEAGPRITMVIEQGSCKMPTPYVTRLI